jgi:phosphate/sulfate permease
MVLAWVLTIPAAAAVSAACFLLLELLGLAG